MMASSGKYEKLETLNQDMRARRFVPTSAQDDHKRRENRTHVDYMNPKKYVKLNFMEEDVDTINQTRFIPTPTEDQCQESEDDTTETKDETCAEYYVRNTPKSMLKSNMEEVVATARNKIQADRVRREPLVQHISKSNQLMRLVLEETQQARRAARNTNATSIDIVRWIHAKHRYNVVSGLLESEVGTRMVANAFVTYKSPGSSKERVDWVATGALCMHVYDVNPFDSAANAVNETLEGVALGALAPLDRL